MSQQSKQNQLQYHDPPAETVLGVGAGAGADATLPPSLPRFKDAPALKKYDPSVLVPSDARSIHASSLPSFNSSSSPSFSGIRSRPSGSSTMNNNPYLSKGKTKTLPKALPRMKQNTENSEASMIRCREDTEQSFIRPRDNSDSQSILRPLPSEGGTNDGKSVLRLVSRTHHDDREGNDSKPPPHIDDPKERFLPNVKISGNAGAAKLDPSITGGSISSHMNEPTMIRPYPNHPSTEHDPLYPSIASLTIVGISDPSTTNPIVSEDSHLGMTRGNVDPWRDNNRSVTSVTNAPLIIPETSGTFLSTEMYSTTVDDIVHEPATYEVSTASDATMAAPQYTSSGRDPSVLTLGNFEDTDNDVFHTEHMNEMESSCRFTDTDHDDTAPSGNSSILPNLNGSQSGLLNFSVNLARKSTTSTSSNSSNGLYLSNGNTSNYFERSLIEEFSHRIEEEQRDSSVMFIPMVSAELDDATTLLTTAPLINTAAAVGQNQYEETNAAQVPQSSHQSQPSVQHQSRPSVPRQSQPSVPRQLSMPQLTKLRQEHGLPVGIVMEIARYQKFAYTYFVCDTNNVEDDCIFECAQLAAEAQSEIIFCLGNGTDVKEILYPQPISSLMTDIQRQQAKTAALYSCVSTIRSPTWSKTPIMQTMHKLSELAQRIPRLDYWRTEKISVVIATNRTFGVDGQEEYSHFIHAIKSLLQIQVQVVIRLSTRDENTVHYFNRIKVLFPTVSVLSTYERQNQLVQKHNPWFNYGEPLHRLRELGYQFHHTIALLSECKLNRDELRVFFLEFYGKKAVMYCPDIRTQWDDFYHFIDSINNREGKHRLGLNPKNKQHREYWINIRKLDSFYSNRRGSLLPRRRSSRRVSTLDQQSLRIEL